MNTNPRLVMIVDDDPDIRDAVSQVLNDNGHLTICAPNGSEALAHLRRLQELPSVILLDLWLPVMSGRQFRTEQKGDPNLASIPVLLFTADRDAGSVAAEMGAAGLVSKPVEYDALLRAVRQFSTWGADR